MLRAVLLSGLLVAVAHSEQALPFTLPLLDGGQFSLDEELGEGPILLDFWATWCRPCIKVLPKVQEVAEEFAELGLKAYTVNMDGPPSQNKVRPFMRRHRLTLPVILDKANQLAKQFHFTALPATAIISGSGEVVYKHVGYRPGDERVLRERVAELVGASGHSKAVKKEGAK